MTESTTTQPGTEKVREEILTRIEKLPSLSNVVNEFLELAQQEYFTAKDFEKVICKDQALVARLLKLANSGKFSRGRIIDTIPEAVVLIGLDNMKKLVYAVSSEGLLRRGLKCYLYPEIGMWLHSMATGILSRAITEASDECMLKGEEAFVAGLIHDVGKLILDDFLDSEPGPREVDQAEEQETCGINHSELGEQILRRWNIPEPVQAAVRYHHEPMAGETCRPEAVVVYLADEICEAWNIGKGALMDLGEEVDPEKYQELLEAIGLSAERFPKLLWDVRQKLAYLESLYEDDDD